VIRLWLVLLVVAAIAKPNKHTGPDPAEMAALEAERCAKDTPEGFQIHTGFASNADPAEALNEALRNARKQAIDGLCAGKSEARCAVILRHLEGWKEPFHNPVTSRACAHIGVNRKWIDDDKGDQAALVANIGKLAAAIAQQGKLIVLQPPLWAKSGCNAGDVGSSIIAELRNALAKSGSIRLARPGASGAKAVQLTLDPTSSEVILTASVTEAVVQGEVPLSGFSFANDLFVLDGSRGDCRFDSELGLVDGMRTGDNGGRVWLDLGETALFCEGDRVVPRVHVDKPSQVKIYSVSRSGKAYLIWPRKGQDGAVDNVKELDSLDLTLTPDGADEKLIAIAMPAGKSWGKTAGWGAFCETPAPFTDESYPKEAAAGAVSFTVQPFDADACLARDVQPYGTAKLPEIPICPAAL